MCHMANNLTGAEVEIHYLLRLGMQSKSIALLGMLLQA